MRSVRSVLIAAKFYPLPAASATFVEAILDEPDLPPW
jgi:hypothetical protein